DTAIVGISNYAQAQLGDIVYVELPAIGKRLGKGEEAAVVESVKAASEGDAPGGGEGTAINSALEASPGTGNRDAGNPRWVRKLKVGKGGELDDLMSEEQYKAFLETIG